MPYRVVKGEFHLFYQGRVRVGSQPDGDSVWFKPNKPKHLEDLDGRSAEFNKGGFAQLRFEAIDALELHFKGARQELDASVAARGFTLRHLGFGNVEYSGGEGLAVRIASPHPRPGYILTKAIDPYGRPVSFVFDGGTNRVDGSDIFMNLAMLNRTVNATLARSGNAYPSFYIGLPVDLRNRVRTLVDSARNRPQPRGMWSKDKTMKSTRVSDLESLEALVIWPKLFRRLVTYFKEGHDGLSDFDSWIHDDPERDDALWIVSEGRLGNLHDTYAVSGNELAMTYSPDDLVVVPR